MKEISRDLVKYRISRARETFHDAKLLADAKRWKSCVNRLYYACFYAVLALLETYGMKSTKHTGVRSLFNRHFVKTGLITKELAQVNNELYDQRHESDYADFITVKEEDTRPYVEGACKLIAAVSNLTKAPKKTK